MADLSSLIRVKKFELDEKQKALGELNAVYNRMTDRLQTLEQEKESEQQAAQDMDAANQSVEMQVAFQHYMTGYKMRRAQIQAALQALDIKIEDAMDEIRDAFAELKRFETIHEARLQAEKDKRKKQDDMELDEIALENFRRKQEE